MDCKLKHGWSRHPSTLEDEAAPLSGFGSPLTISEPSAAKKPSPVQRSDTASSWTIAADFAEGQCLG